MHVQRGREDVTILMIGESSFRGPLPDSSGICEKVVRMEIPSYNEMQSG